jgi:hypothetical protein
MPKKLVRRKTEDIREMIYTIRGQRVIMDFDLATIYGVPTKRLNEQVKRNKKRFPNDFRFQLNSKEWSHLISKLAISQEQVDRSQFATGSQTHRDPRFRPYAFTEHGAVMAANILHSDRAVQMSIFVVRAFVKMRALLGDSRELARRLAVLERALKERLDVHEVAIVSVLHRVMDLIDPPSFPHPPHKPIGFKVKEHSVKYHVKKRKS